MHRLVVATALLAAATGCAGNRISGEVRGEEIDIEQGLFLQDDQDDYGLIVAMLASVDRDCDAWDDFLDEMEDASDGEERAELWEEFLPQDWWLVSLTIRVDDVSTNQSDVDLFGEDWDEPLDEDAEARAALLHYEDYPTASELSIWGLWFGDADYVDEFSTHEGEGEFRRHEPGESVSGVFDSTVVDDDGDDSGEIEIHFAADRCRDLEDDLL